jgi:hypothetical protein
MGYGLGWPAAQRNPVTIGDIARNANSFIAVLLIAQFCISEELF